MSRITSMKHPLIQAARQATVDLLSSSVLLQDWAACRWALDAGLPLQTIFVCESTPEKASIVSVLREKQLPYHELSSGLMQKIKQTKYSSPVVALCDPSSLIKPPSGSLVLILDHLQDPGNIGTIMRSARAFGVSHVVCVGDTAMFHKKAISAARGHVFTGSYQSFDTPEEAAAYYQQAGYTVAYTAMQAEHSVASAAESIRGPLTLVVGNETTGCDARWAGCADTAIRIPMLESVESLNVAVAAGICCYVLKR